MNYQERTCYGVAVDFDGEGESHAPTEMESVENAIGDVQYRCPECGVLVE